MQGAWRLRGAMDVAALQRGIDEIVARHDILRTSFRALDGLPMQIVSDRQPLALEVETLRAAADLQAIVDDAGGAPFDLENGPLLRARLVRIAEQEHLLSLTVHHLVADGWSMDVLLDELRLLYEAFVAGSPSPLPDLAIQYADYAAWQREQTETRLRDQLDFWSHCPAAQGWRCHRPSRPAVASHRGAGSQASPRTWRSGCAP